MRRTNLIGARHRIWVWWLAVLLMGCGVRAEAQISILNVSYDVSREFYKDYNAAFVRHWKQVSAEDVVINQSHGGSSKQVRSILEGLPADVVTMNQDNDIDLLHDRGNFVRADWASQLPDHSAPTTSVTVFLVRKGNPRHIKDWGDLAKAGVSVIVANPKTSGNGRYSYLAAWGSVIKRGGSAQQAAGLVRGIFANVPVFDGGGRAATTTFIERRIGDVLVTFESEVQPIRQEFGDTFDVVYPPVTILAENPVAVVDKVVDQRGTRREAEAYLKYLWSQEGQTIAARHHLRPRDPSVAKEFASAFPPVQTFTVDEVFGGWKKAQADHFNDGARFDQILASIHR